LIHIISHRQSKSRFSNIFPFLQPFQPFLVLISKSITLKCILIYAPLRTNPTTTMTITRQSIIDRYRDRIASDQRTRLPKDELWELIHGFINHLATLKTKSSIKAFCRSEIALLEEGYPKATVGKVYIPKYRAAIRDAIDHGSLPMTKNTSRQYPYTKRNTGESGISIDHLALDYLKYDQETYEQFAPSAPHLKPIHHHRSTMTNLPTYSKKSPGFGRTLTLHQHPKPTS
jgi:hypothetical protein